MLDLYIIKKRVDPYRFIGRMIVLLVSGILVSGCLVDIQPLPDTVDEELDHALNRGFDGIIVYINQAGESRFYAAGWMDREKQIPADPHALFKIASISKLYIAAATTKLVADHTLSLDNTLAELLPDVAPRIEYADEITLRMLLQHRSGIPNFSDHPDFPWDHPLEENHETYKYILDMPADFKPNKKYRYSNTNYFLIGDILDRTLGYSHHQYIRREILDPLALENTYSLLSEVDLEDVMSGYTMGYDPDLKSHDFIQPGGSMVATAEDVGIFLRSLIDGTLFNAEEQAIYSSVYEYEHTGWLPGYTSIARYYTDIDAVVVQFVNTSSGELFWLDLRRVYNRIVRILETEQ